MVLTTVILSCIHGSNWMISATLMISFMTCVFEILAFEDKL